MFHCFRDIAVEAVSMIFIEVNTRPEFTYFLCTMHSFEEKLMDMHVDGVVLKSIPYGFIYF